MFCCSRTSHTLRVWFARLGVRQCPKHIRVCTVPDRYQGTPIIAKITNSIGKPILPTVAILRAGTHAPTHKAYSRIRRGCPWEFPCHNLFTRFLHAPARSAIPRGILWFCMWLYTYVMVNHVMKSQESLSVDSFGQNCVLTYMVDIIVWMYGMQCGWSTRPILEPHSWIQLRDCRAVCGSHWIQASLTRSVAMSMYHCKETPPHSNHMCTMGTTLSSRQVQAWCTMQQWSTSWIHWPARTPQQCTTSVNILALGARHIWEWENTQADALSHKGFLHGAAKCQGALPDPIPVGATGGIHTSVDPSTTQIYHSAQKSYMDFY